MKDPRLSKGLKFYEKGYFFKHSDPQNNFERYFSSITLFYGTKWHSHHANRTYKVTWNACPFQKSLQRQFFQLLFQIQRALAPRLCFVSFCFLGVLLLFFSWKALNMDDEIISFFKICYLSWNTWDTLCLSIMEASHRKPLEKSFQFSNITLAQNFIKDIYKSFFQQREHYKLLSRASYYLFQLMSFGSRVFVNCWEMPGFENFLKSDSGGRRNHSINESKSEMSHSSPYFCSWIWVVNGWWTNIRQIGIGLGWSSTKRCPILRVPHKLTQSWD